MRDEVRILPATEEGHFSAIQKLAHEIWHEHYPGIISVAQIDYMLELGYSVGAMRADVEERRIHYDRALHGGELIGFSAYGPGRDPEKLMLHKLYVHADQRGTGCGRALLEAASRHASTNALRSIVVTVNKQNCSAIDAYEKMGFENRGPVVADIGNGFVMDDYLMEVTNLR